MEDLDGFLKENQQISLDDALTNPGFELFLMQYFESLRVEVKDQNGILREICQKANTLLHQVESENGHREENYRKD